MKYTGDAIQVTCDVADIAHDALSATHSDTLAGAVVLGDVIHGNATPKWARLAGNTTAVKQFLSQTGTGSASAVPAWATLVASNVSDFDEAAQDAVGGIMGNGLTYADGTPSIVVNTAVASDVNTGTSTSVCVTPDALAGSNLGIKNVVIDVVYPSSALVAGDGQAYFSVPAEFHGMNLVSVGARVITAGSSGTVDIQFARIRVGSGAGTVDMLSTLLTVDATETDSFTAATPAAINASNDDVSANATNYDTIRVDIDAIGTDAKGLQVRLGFQLP